jgi:hypothetical protein
MAAHDGRNVQRQLGEQEISGFSGGKPLSSHNVRISGKKIQPIRPAFTKLQSTGELDENCHHRPVQYLNNILEQDHRAIKRRCRASQWFRSFWSALRTIAGYEAIHMIRKGQSAWTKGAGSLNHFIVSLFAAAV